MIYSELLAEVHRRLAREWNVSDAETDAVAFGKVGSGLAGVSGTVASLQYLQRYYKLVILSNVDRGEFRGVEPAARCGFRCHLHGAGYRLVQAGSAQFRVSHQRGGRGSGC